MLRGRVNSQVRVVPALPQEGSVMNLFTRIFNEATSLDSSTDYTTPIKLEQVQETATEAESAFRSFIKESLIYGSSVLSTHETDSYGDTTEASYEEESPIDDDDVLDGLAEESPPPSYLPVAAPKPLSHLDIVQQTASEQKDDPQVARIVDQLFDRMSSVWGPRPKAEPQMAAKKPSPPPQRDHRRESTALVKAQRNVIAESKNEVVKTIRTEIPRAMKGEILTLLRKEILSAVRGELVRVIRDEFGTMGSVLAKITDRLRAMETRMAKMEGNLEKEITVSFPKGAIQIDSPVTVTVPEREVKVAAPINVHPPNVVFDEGAIKVEFTKGRSASRKVTFNRDRRDNIQSAEIVDVPER